MNRPDRFPPLPPDQLTPAQAQALSEIRSGPRGEGVGPFVPLLRSPELMTRLQRTGEYLRFQSQVQPRLLELSILLVARAWDQQFEWSYHHPLALAAGLDPALVQAIAEGRCPEETDEDIRAVWVLVHELHRDRDVSDATFGRAVAALGEAGVIELVAAVGYYTTLAMIMNVAHTPAPAGPALPPRLPSQTSLSGREPQ